jgi:hypothetical protein
MMEQNALLRAMKRAGTRSCSIACEILPVGVALVVGCASPQMPDGRSSGDSGAERGGGAERRMDIREGCCPKDLSHPEVIETNKLERKPGGCIVAPGVQGQAQLQAAHMRRDP